MAAPIFLFIKVNYAFAHQNFHSQETERNCFFPFLNKELWDGEHLQLWTKGCRRIQKKLSKVGFSMECFAADFLWLASESFKNWLCGSHQGGRLQIQAFQGFP